MAGVAGSNSKPLLKVCITRFGEFKKSRPQTEGGFFVKMCLLFKATHSPRRSRGLKRIVMLLRVIVVVILGVCGANVALADGETLTLEYEAAQMLPDFQIDGKLARIHTQGLVVTEQHYFVTGRLETQPRRALFLRFDRKHPEKVEYVDITPAQKPQEDKLRLDHPGGFDFDGMNFWIPISASKPNSRTVILRFPHHPDRPLKETSGTTAFNWADHIGAIAFDRTAKDLYGANWDTKIVYRWKPDGKLVEQIPRTQLVQGDSNWALAVQDWKGIGEGRLLAGGIDKRRNRDPKSSKALVAILDINRRTLPGFKHLPPPEAAKHTLTREGMAVYAGQLFFLPGDLGEQAQIFRYRWREREPVR